MPLAMPTTASLPRTRRELLQVSSPRAMPRTITVSVWVAALPPMLATTVMSAASAMICSTRRLELSHHERRQGGRDQVHPEPRQPLAPCLPRRREHVLVGGNARQTQDVLGGLVLDDVDDVVHGDDADQLVLVVDDRNGQQVVVGHLLGDLLLVGVDAGLDQLRRHDPLERRLRRDQQQSAQRHHAHQVTPLVDDVGDRRPSRLRASAAAPRWPRPAVRSSARAKTSGFMMRPAVWSP